METQRTIPVLRAAVARHPERLDLLSRLVAALCESDRVAEVVTLLAPGAARGALPPALDFQFGRAATASGERTAMALAVSALERACAAHVDGAQGELAQVHARLGDDEAAVAIGRATLETSPHDVAALRAVASGLLAQRKAAELLTLCEALLRQGGSAAILATRAAALSATGGSGDAPSIGSQLSCEMLTVGDDFNRALAAEILADEPAANLNSLKAGNGEIRRISNLSNAGGPLALRALDMIGDRIARYRRRRNDGASSGERRPGSAVRLDCWAIVSEATGHQDWHIHPSGEVSGVYYVAVPGGGDRAGSIAFAPHVLQGDIGDSDEMVVIRPEPGMLLLFPSHIAHRTWPSESTATRICLAFDAIPDGR